MQKQNESTKDIIEASKPNQNQNEVQEVNEKITVESSKKKYKATPVKKKYKVTPVKKSKEDLEEFLMNR